MLKREAIPSLLIVVMGLLDCVTTIVGVVFSGDKEMNPAMAFIVNSNVGAFLAVKVAATVFIAFTYVLARKVLMDMPDKNNRTFSYSMRGLTFVYLGLVGVLGFAIANNLLILIH